MCCQGALCSGRRVAVFDLGAQADRARRHDPQHLTLPLELAERPDELLDILLRSARAPDPGSDPRPAENAEAFVMHRNGS